MVSQNKTRWRRADPGAARRRLLAAAAGEFAARGYDGARVDRIAAAARVNKALVYYYFRSKAGLYGEVLGDLFAAVAAAVAEVRERGGAPDAQLVDFIRALGHEAVARPHVPAIWLREMADGGRHVGPAIVADVRRVLDTLTAILDDGRRAQRFAPVPPLVVHLTIVAPLMIFLASAPVRQRLAPRDRPALAAADPAAMIAHLETSVLAAVTQPRPGAAARRSAS